MSQKTKRKERKEGRTSADRDVGKGNPSLYSVVETYISTISCRTLELPQKLKIELAYDPARQLLRYFKEGNGTRKHTRSSVYSRTVLHSRGMETTNRRLKEIQYR